VSGLSSDDEEKIRRLVLELRVLESSAGTIQSRMRVVEAAITELRVANSTLDGLKGRERSTPMLIPVGGGSYVKAELGDVDRVIYGVGAGVALEKTFEEAKASANNQIGELEKIFSSLQQQLVQVSTRIEETRSQIDDLTKRMDEGSRGVREA